jgi:hypothetical protein
LSPARKTFVWIASIGLVAGLLVGVIELVAPDLASVTLNDRDMTGFAGFVVATAIGLVAGVILGLIAGGIVKLATRGPRKPA